MIEKCSPDEIKRNEREALEWKDEIKRLQGLLSKESTRNNIRDQEIPNLATEISDLEASLQEATPTKDSVR